MLAGSTNLVDLISTMKNGLQNHQKSSRARWVNVTMKSALALLFVVIGVFSWTTTESGFYDYQEYHTDDIDDTKSWYMGIVEAIFSLSSVNLARAELTPVPQYWISYENWLTDWDQQFRNREAIAQSAPVNRWPDDKLRKYRAEVIARWSDLTNSLRGPNLITLTFALRIWSLRC